MQWGFIPSLIFYILGILIIAITFRISLRKQRTPDSNDWKSSLEAEHQLEFVRNKSLDTALFLQIDFKKIPYIEDEKCKKHYLALMRYADLPMVNLQGNSNLELKKNMDLKLSHMLGTMNVTILSLCKKLFVIVSI